MKPQTIVTTNDERLVVLTEADYEALVEAAEDASDLRAVKEFQRKLAAGEEAFVPASIVDRLLDSDESRIKVWREHRGLTAKALAEKAGIDEGVLSQIETRERIGTEDMLRNVAVALNVTTDDLIDKAPSD